LLPKPSWTVAHLPPSSFNCLNKIFKGNFQQVLDDIIAILYPVKREAA
jgi:hypothetical protein